MSPNILDSSTFTIVLMGVSLGLVHVLSGPDHLSALAALSNGIPSKAFSLGIRWGLGHAFGIFIMTMILRSIRLNFTNAQSQMVIDCLVAFVMILFGFYSIYQAFSRYKKMKKRNKEIKIASYLEELSKEITRDNEQSINDYDNTQIVYNYPEEEYISNHLLKNIISSHVKGDSEYNRSSISPRSLEKKVFLLNKPKEEQFPKVHLPKVAKIIHKMKLKKNIIPEHTPTETPPFSPSSDVEEGSKSTSSKNSNMSISDEESIKNSNKSDKSKIKYFNLKSKKNNVEFSETILTSNSNPNDVEKHNDHHFDLSSFTSFYTICFNGFNKFFTVDIYHDETQKSAAFFIGILHGASGPGVFLGLLPAIKLSKFNASLIYLLSFTISSTISMGLFALTYTSMTKVLSKRVGTDRVELLISLFSAFLSLAFGFFWLLTTILFPYSPFNFNNHV